MLIDVHAHILPCIDDGPSSVEMCLEMLKNSRLRGIDTVIATSHCYLKEDNDVHIFLKRRKDSYEILKAAMDRDGGDFPEIILGCELHMEYDISSTPDIEKLCIEGTKYMLIEMPYSYWAESLYDSLYSLSIRGITPIMAHIERFYAHIDDFDMLWDLNVMYQVNADSFLKDKISKKMNYIFENEMVQLIGSDMHNIEKRTQKISEAYAVIEKLYGKECVDYLNKNSELLIKNEKLITESFKKKSFFARLLK